MARDTPSDEPARRRVFISYAREDADWARVCATLSRAHGHDVFLDTDSIRSGEDWPQRLQTELARADQVLLVWTERTHASEWVRREYLTALALREARGDDGFLQIYNVDGSPVPDVLRDIQALPPPQVRPRSTPLLYRIGSVVSLFPLLWLWLGAKAFSGTTLLACIALALIGVGLPLVSRWASSRWDRIGRGLVDLGARLRTHRARRVLETGAAVIHRVYGERVLSWRTLIRATALSVVAVASCAALSVWLFGWEAGSEIFRRPLVGDIPYGAWMVGTNMISDVLALSVTFWLLGRALRVESPTPARLAGLLAVDLLVAVALTVLPTLLGPMLADFVRTGEWLAGHPLSFELPIWGAIRSPFPQIFYRPDVFIPTAAGEWFLWHGGPLRETLFIGLQMPNSIVGLVGIACLFTACLPTLIVAVTLITAAASGRVFPRVARWLVSLGQTRRSRTARAYGAICPLLLFIAVTLIVVDRPGEPTGPRFEALSTATLVEGCRVGHGLDAVDQCIAAARRLRGRRDFDMLFRVLSVSRNRLTARIRPTTDPACAGAESCRAIGAATLDRLVQQVALGDLDLILRFVLPIRVGSGGDLRIGGRVVSAAGGTLAGHLEAIIAAAGQRRVDVTQEYSGAVRRRVYIVGGPEPEMAEPIELHPFGQRVEFDGSRPVAVCRGPLSVRPPVDAPPSGRVSSRPRVDAPPSGRVSSRPSVDAPPSVLALGGAPGTAWRFDPAVPTADADHTRPRPLWWFGTSTDAPIGAGLPYLAAGAQLPYRARAFAGSGSSLKHAMHWPRCLPLSAHPTVMPATAAGTERWVEWLPGVWRNEFILEPGETFTVRSPMTLASAWHAGAPLHASDPARGLAWSDRVRVHTTADGWRGRWTSCGETLSFRAVGPRPVRVVVGAALQRLPGGDGFRSTPMVPIPRPAAAPPQAPEIGVCRAVDASGWLAVDAPAVAVRVSDDPPLIATAGAFVGRVVERRADGTRLSVSALSSKPPGSVSPLFGGLAIRLGRGDSARHPYSAIAATTEVGDSLAGNLDAGDVGGPLGNLLLRRHDRIVAVNGIAVGDQPRRWLDSEAPTALLRMRDDDRITLQIERRDPMQGPGLRLPYPLTVEYTPHPLDPEASRAWLDEVIGPRPDTASASADAP